MDMKMYFSIVGYTISLIFGPTEWPNKQAQLLESVGTLFGPFKTTPQKNCDAQIFIRETTAIPFRTFKNVTYNKGYVRIRKNIYETYYHVSIYELAQLILIVVTNLLGKEGFLLHAAGVFAKKKAVLFIGSSGSGKSTITRKLFPEYGIVGDDCVAIREQGKGFMCYQVPWIEKDESSIMKSSFSYPILHIFAVKKHIHFRIKTINPPQSVAEIAKNIWSFDGVSKDVLYTVTNFINSGIKISRAYLTLHDGKKLSEIISTL